MSLGTRLLSYATSAATKIAATLATGALSALGSLEIDKIFEKGIVIPFKFLPSLAAIGNELTERQKGLINNAYQSGSGLNWCTCASCGVKKYRFVKSDETSTTSKKPVK